MHWPCTGNQIVMGLLMFDPVERGGGWITDTKRWGIKKWKPGRTDGWAPGYRALTPAKQTFVFQSVFIVGWIKADVDQSPPPPPLPIRGSCHNGALRRGVAPVRAAQRSTSGLILSRALWVSESRQSCQPGLIHLWCSLMRKLVGPHQGIVSSKWCPLIARKPRLFLVSDGWSSF